MIKTTSFTRSHPAQNASGASTRTRQHVIKAARTRATAPSQPNSGTLFPAPIPVPEISAAQAREIIQGSAPKSKPGSKPRTAPVQLAPIASHPLPKVETTMPSTSPAPIKTPRTTKRKESVSLPPQAPVVAPIEVAPLEAVPAVAEKAAPKKAASAAPKTRRPRVPANLAEQYGQSLSKRVESGAEVVVEDDSPKKRLSRAERQARRDLMNPDDDLLARLHRAHNTVPTAKPEKRPRGWRFDCGRCGQTSYFQTNGAICNCGALAIKD